MASFANIKWCKKPWKIIETLDMGTHLRVLSESYVQWIPCALDESSLRIGMV